MSKPEAKIGAYRCLAYIAVLGSNRQALLEFFDPGICNPADRAPEELTVSQETLHCQSDHKAFVAEQVSLHAIY